MKIAISQLCLAAVGLFRGVHWSLTRAAATAKEIGADGIGIYPLFGSTREIGPTKGKLEAPLAVEPSFINGPWDSTEGWLGRSVFTDSVAAPRFTFWISEYLGIPVETHSAKEARRNVTRGREAWLETIPEKGLSFEDHLRLAKEGDFYLAVDTMDIIDRHGLEHPFGWPDTVMRGFIRSGRVRNIHAHPTRTEVRSILRKRGYETELRCLLEAACEELKRTGQRSLVTLEVGPFELWPNDPLTMTSSKRYLKRLKQILTWVRSQVEK